MKKILLSGLVALAFVGFANAAEYSIDKTHSSVNFKIKHLSISNVSGKFTDYDAVIDATNGKLNKLNATIKVASVDTDNEKRDNHLKSADFFDVSKFQDMKFELQGYDNDDIVGLLTIKDVTKKVELDYDFGGTTVGQDGKERIGFSLEGKIKRSDFNFAPNFSNLTLGEDIKINIEVEAVAK